MTRDSLAKVAIQDQLKDNYCFGCGADNPHGMQIKSFWDGETSICHYLPKPEQSAGPTHYVYGGTIASLIDCHCVGTAIADHYQRDGREVGTEPEIWCVTARLSVNYLAPTPIDQQIVLSARVKERGEKKSVIQCQVMSGDIRTAEGEVIAIRVADSWRKGV